MAEGSLRCCGSSLFLKDHYGVGYNLTIEKRSSSSSSSSTLHHLITTHVPTTQLLSESGNEVIYRLPSSSSSSFPSLLHAMDNQIEPLGIVTYGMSMTTLEEVFIRVANGSSSSSSSSGGGRLISDEECKAPSKPEEEEEEGGGGGDKGRRRKSSPSSPVHNDDDDDDDDYDVDYHDHWYFLGRHLYALLMKRMLCAKRDKKSWYLQVNNRS